ncbi:shTK domain protein [Ostertagia ostertagi]
MLLHCICLSLIFGFAIHTGVEAYKPAGPGLGLDPVPPKVDCKDHLANCDRNMKKGLCHLLLRFCQKSCGLCECKDVAPDPTMCPRAKQYGYCDSQRDSTTFWCRQTCDRCDELENLKNQ